MYPANEPPAPAQGSTDVSHVNSGIVLAHPQALPHVATWLSETNRNKVHIKQRKFGDQPALRMALAGAQADFLKQCVKERAPLLPLLLTNSPPLSLRYSEPDAWRAASGPPKWRLLRCLPRLDHEWAFDGSFTDLGAKKASHGHPAPPSAGLPPAEVLREPGGLMLPSAVHILGVDNKSAAMAGLGLVSCGGVARGPARPNSLLLSTVAADLARARGLLVPWRANLGVGEGSGGP